MYNRSVSRHLVVLVFCCIATGFQAKKFARIDLSGHAQGTTWHILYYTNASTVTRRQIDSIFQAIDASMSIYDSASRICRFNADKRGVLIDSHLRKIVSRSIEVFHQTSGYFDITILPIVEAWGFAAKKFDHVPDSQTIASLLKSVGTPKIQVKHDSLIKHDPSTRIDVNSIAQGYTVDVIAEYLERNHIMNYLVEVGGEIRAKGKKLIEDAPFTVGIESPGKDDSLLVRRSLSISRGAITTSGNYRKFHESGGKKWSHIMDPHTGYPIVNELISVTVFAEDATTADAFDTPLMAMGLKRSFAFLKMHKDLAAYFIFRRADGSIADTATKSFLPLLNR